MSRNTTGKYHDAPEHATTSILGIDAPEYVPPHSTLEVGAPKDGYAVRVMDAGLSRRLGDMKASSFWLYLGIICVVVVGATVGGAVGGTMAAKNHQVVVVSQSISASSTSISPTTTALSSSSVTSSPTSSTLSPTSTSTSTFFPTSNCSAVGNLTTYSSLFLSSNDGTPSPSAGLSFKLLCAVEAADPNIGSAYVYTFQDCIEVCAGINFWFGDRRCVSAAFLPKGNRPVNCWAHMNTTTLTSNGDYDTAVLI